MKIIDKIEIINCKIIIKKKIINNALLKLAIDDNKNIIKYSNDYLYLLDISDNYKKEIYLLYDKIIHNSFKYFNIGTNKIINHNIFILQSTIKYINKIKLNIISDIVVDFTTIFSIGTAHGYAGLFNIIDNYLKYYNNYKIIVYKESQQGILDIINKIISNDKIIYIESDIIYQFDKIYFIPNQYHDFDVNFSNRINYILNDYLIDKNYIYSFPYNKLCIIKSSISENITNNGIVKQNIIDIYCKKNNYISLEPTKYNEIELINILYNCEELVVSWGTAFFKNFHYISDRCLNIRVLVFCKHYLYEYNNHKIKNVLIYNYKNAIINYILIDDIINYLQL